MKAYVKEEWASLEKFVNLHELPSIKSSIMALPSYRQRHW